LLGLNGLLSMGVRWFDRVASVSIERESTFLQPPQIIGWVAHKQNPTATHQHPKTCWILCFNPTYRNIKLKYGINTVEILKLLEGIMLYKIDYSFTGKMISIGNLYIGRTSFFERIANIDNINITYNLFGRVLTINNQNCSYKGWLSSLVSVGTTQVVRDRSKILAVGDIKILYGDWGRIQSIGDLQVRYGNFGRIAEIITIGDRDLTNHQKIALTVILLEIQEAENSP
jgi:hypothetical protein